MSTANLPSAAPRVSIKRQMTKLFLIIAISMLIIIAALLITLVSISRQYTSALQNANTAADFNKEFKKTLDLEMYNHVIRARSPDSVAELPLGELNEAVEVLNRLERSTTLRDNRWRILSMLNMCESLKGYMIEIAQCERYDDRMELLERNIRGETGLTLLIETYMHDYIDDEVRELARLQGEIGTQVTVVIALTVAGVLLLFALMLLYSVHFAGRITQPIAQLAEKALKLGEGDFSVTPIATSSTELHTLDKGFDEMVGRINTLLGKQIEDQKTLHRAELELLQAQINPHFLYNTLDSIVILAENHRDEEVIQMVTSLSVFFRNSLSRGKDIITLRAERDQVMSYLQIQQIRYSDILNYEIDIPEELLDERVPKLVLQPLVENALYHGTKNKRGVGTIFISGKSMGGDMLLTVRDNGAGMDEEQIATLKAGIYADRHTGLGLVNVHKRIKLYCGEAYGLSFESALGAGTTVFILLPKGMEDKP
ncbi:MAG: sensor histidine kinase [Oscillospiraceae bacterium]|jgi:two-component system sensor histidine kinase YesM|nr:sensor histidine kinase [Oscillospiraceae bacterium]